MYTFDLSKKGLSNAYLHGLQKVLGAFQSSSRGSLAIPNTLGYEILGGRTDSNDEVLKTQILSCGSAHFPRWIVITAGVHGVEGLLGSWLLHELGNDADLLDSIIAQDISLLVMNGVNPWGYAWLTRSDERGCDPNRLLGFDHRNPLFTQHADILCPPEMTEEAWQRVVTLRDSLGQAEFQQMLTAGQNTHRYGPFYSDGNRGHVHGVITNTLTEYLRNATDAVWIDIHSGIGPRGVTTLLTSETDPRSPALARMRAWFDPDNTFGSPTAVLMAPLMDQTGISAKIEGPLFQDIGRQLLFTKPDIKLTAVAAETGVLPFMEATRRILADAALHRKAHEDSQLITAYSEWEEVKRGMVEAFWSDEQGWQTSVREQFFEILRKAVRGISST